MQAVKEPTLEQSAVMNSAVNTRSGNLSRPRISLYRISDCSTDVPAMSETPFHVQLVSLQIAYLITRMLNYGGINIHFQQIIKERSKTYGQIRNCQS